MELLTLAEQETTICFKRKNLSTGHNMLPLRTLVLKLKITAFTATGAGVVPFVEIHHLGWMWISIVI